MNQCEEVIKAMKGNGGYATFGFLNQNVDVSEWGTKTPFASIRRIVQTNDCFFKIKPGLWALKEYEKEVLQKFSIQDVSNKEKQEVFTHSYYQGLLLEIGNMKGFGTYQPAQDKNKKFLDKPLCEISTVSPLFAFTYPNIIEKAKSIDVIWFNERCMPYSFFEVEHTTDIKNSLLKFVELQDFYSRFYIVASKERKKEYEQKYSMAAFTRLKKENRVEFRDYDYVSKLHTRTFELSALGEL